LISTIPFCFHAALTGRADFMSAIVQGRYKTGPTTETVSLHKVEPILHRLPSPRLMNPAKPPESFAPGPAGRGLGRRAS
jgi:hypothetical protein